MILQVVCIQHKVLNNEPMGYFVQYLILARISRIPLNKYLLLITSLSNEASFSRLVTALSTLFLFFPLENHPLDIYTSFSSSVCILIHLNTLQLMRHLDQFFSLRLELLFLLNGLTRRSLKFIFTIIYKNRPLFIGFN